MPSLGLSLGIDFPKPRIGPSDPLAGISFSLRLQTHKREILKRDTVTVSGASNPVADGDYAKTSDPLYWRAQNGWYLVFSGGQWYLAPAPGQSIAVSIGPDVGANPSEGIYTAVGGGSAPTVTFTANKSQYLSDGVSPIYKPLGLYKDVACTEEATEEEESIAGWKDVLSNSGLAATQSNSMKRPTLQFLGGVPVTRLDGVDDYYNTLDLVLTEFSVFALIRQTGDGAVMGGVDSAPQLRIGQFSANRLSSYDNTANPQSNLLGIEQGSWSLLEFIASEGTMSFLQNGVAYGSGIFDGPATFNQIGAFASGAANRLSGDMVALLVSSTSLNESDRQKVEQYLLTLVP